MSNDNIHNTWVLFDGTIEKWQKITHLQEINNWVQQSLHNSLNVPSHENIYVYIFFPPHHLDWIRGFFFSCSVCVQAEAEWVSKRKRKSVFTLEPAGENEASTLSWADNDDRLSTSFTYVDVDGRRCSMPTMHKRFSAHSYDAGYCQFWLLIGV